MAQSSYPFDEQSVTEDQWSAMMTTVAESRVVTGLAVFGDSSGRQVKAALGTAWVRGHYYVSTAEETLTIGANASGNPRIDTVVLKLDPTANSIVLAVVAGTAAAAPVPPTLTQTATGVWEHPLADVKVANGASTIAATDVTPRARIATATVGRNIPGHNLLHNGAMQVAQRGTSTAGLTGISGLYYTADRWASYISGVGTWTQSVETDAPTGSGFRKSLKMLITAGAETPTPGGAGDYVRVVQAIEGQNLQAVKKGTASAEPLTLSFWTKSNKTGTYIVELYDADNTRAVSATYTVASSGTWEQQTVTFPADLTGAFDNDNAASLSVVFHLAAGSNFTSGTLATTWAAYSAANRAVGQTNLASDTSNYWMVTGVQLEVGSASTGFEHKSYGTELSECQRYYQRGLRTVAGYAASATLARCGVTFPVTMRTNPTEMILHGAGTVNHTGGNPVPSALTANGLYPDGAYIDLTVTGLTTGEGLVAVAQSYGISADL